MDVRGEHVEIMRFGGELSLVFLGCHSEDSAHQHRRRARLRGLCVSHTATGIEVVTGFCVGVLGNWVSGLGR